VPLSAPACETVMATTSVAVICEMFVVERPETVAFDNPTREYDIADPQALTVRLTHSHANHF